MIKQYLILGLLLLGGVLLLYSLEWGGPSEQPIQIAGSRSKNSTINDQAHQKNDLADLRSGGISSKRKNRKTFAPNSTRTLGGSSTGIATSTPNRLETDNGSDSNDQPSHYPLPGASAVSQSSVNVAENESNNRNPASSTPGSSKASPQKTTDTTKKSTTASEQDQKQNAAEENDIDTDADADDNSEPTSPELNTSIQITGSVVDTTGHLISGLGLSLKLSQASKENKAVFGKRNLQSQTNDKGQYQFRNLVEGSYQVCTLAANGYTALCKNVLAPHLSADFTLVGTLNGGVYGVVIDEQGAPVGDVSVSASPQQTTRTKTDKEGRFDLQLAVNAGANYQIYFSKAGYARNTVPLKGDEILARKQIQTTITALQGFDVKGQVLDQSGEAVNGVVVRLHSPSVKTNVQLRGNSNQNGNFTIKYAKAADDYSLSISKGQYTYEKGYYQNISVYEGMPRIEVRVQAMAFGRGSLGVTLMNPNSLAVSNVSLRLQSGRYSSNEVTDQSGQATFTDVQVKQAGNPITLTSHNNDPRYTFSGITLADGEFPSKQLRVSNGGYSLTVSVVDEQNLRLKGAQGTLTWQLKADGVIHTTQRIKKTAKQDSGSFIFTSLSAGKHTLTITRGGYKTYTAEININLLDQSHRASMKKN